MIFAGIGNLGNKYEHNRHNIGFKIIDFIVKHLNLEFQYFNKYKSEIAIYHYLDHKVFFVKPQTFVNLSGASIASLKNFYKINNDKIHIIHDELEMKFGRVVSGFNGSARGHNGLRSISQMIGSDFWHIRFGIGKPQCNNIAQYVLSNFRDFEMDQFNTIFDIVSQFIIEIINGAVMDTKIKKEICAAYIK